MTVNRNHFIAPRQREALITLTAISYIEEHQLLKPEQLVDAKKNLHVLFLRASGEETLLRKLIEMLKASRHIHHSFASIAGILGGVSKSVTVLDEKVARLKAQIEQTPITAEAHADFLGAFLAFSQDFLRKASAFHQGLSAYLDTREQEARMQSMYQIALDARERLRRRLAGNLGQASGAAEVLIRNEIVSSFDYGEAGTKLEAARHHTQTKAQEAQEHLGAIQAMCGMAMNPALRDRYARVEPQDDIFIRFTETLPRHACLVDIKDAVLELFRLYQHSHGMFQLDYQKLHRALETMMRNTDAYFQAKQEDRDVTAKREKLHKIEGLIPFLEQAAGLAGDDSMAAYPTFSRQLSATVSERRAAWSHIADDLLRAKVQAEAEISTRL